MADLVQLPARKPEVVARVRRAAPLWPIFPAITRTPSRPTAFNLNNLVGTAENGKACYTSIRSASECCQTLKDPKERHLINPDLVRDIIIGLSDGLTVPFGLTAGLAAFSTAHVVVVGGVAELISGSLSMGVGGYLSAKAERDHYLYMLKSTRARVKRCCVGALQQEVTEVLGQLGVRESSCRQVAMDLLDAETLEKASPAGRKTKSKEEIEDLGLSHFLVRFGEGEERVEQSRLIISAFAIGISYLVGGVIPLLPYFFMHDVTHALFVSAGITGFVLVIFGMVKAYYTGSEIGWYGYTKGAIYTLGIGGAAAGSAYGISRGIESAWR